MDSSRKVTPEEARKALAIDAHNKLTVTKIQKEFWQRESNRIKSESKKWEKTARENALKRPNAQLNGAQQSIMETERFLAFLELTEEHAK